jgi:hypothetical protein
VSVSEELVYHPHHIPCRPHPCVGALEVPCEEVPCLEGWQGLHRRAQHPQRLLKEPAGPHPLLSAPQVPCEHGLLPEGPALQLRQGHTRRPPLPRHLQGTK